MPSVSVTRIVYCFLCQSITQTQIHTHTNPNAHFKEKAHYLHHTVLHGLRGYIMERYFTHSARKGNLCRIGFTLVLKKRKMVLYI